VIKQGSQARKKGEIGQTLGERVESRAGVKPFDNSWDRGIWSCAMWRQNAPKRWSVFTCSCSVAGSDLTSL
jgi:hypothetical protein